MMVVGLESWVVGLSLTNTWASVVFWSGEAKNLWVKWCFCDLGGDSSSTLVVFARGGGGRLDDDIMWW